jgi:hypothetical protein
VSHQDPLLTFASLHFDGTPFTQKDLPLCAIIFVLTDAVSDQDLPCTVEIHERLLVVSVRPAHAPQSDEEQYHQNQSCGLDHLLRHCSAQH